MAPGCFSSDRVIKFSLGLWNLLQQPQQKRDQVAKHDAIVNNHNQQVKEEAKVLDNQKKAIRETKKLEETSHNRPMNRLVRMKEISKKIE